jgi:prepilin-type processing-associated H-X9-DG protein
MKQIGLGFMQYVQDFDEELPCGYKTTGGGAGWAGQVYPYVKSTKVFVCPSDPSSKPQCSYGVNGNLAPLANGVAGTQAGIFINKMVQPGKTVYLFEVYRTGQTNTWNPQTEFGYQQSGQGLSALGGHSSPTGLGTGQNYDPVGADGGITDAQAVSAIASGSTFMQYATGFPNNMTTNVGGYAMFTGAMGAHENGSTYLFCDGHAKWALGSQIWAGSTNGLTGNGCGGSGDSGWARSFNCSDQTFVGTYSYQ